MSHIVSYEVNSW